MEDNHPLFNLQPPTSNLQPPTSNLQPPTSNLQPPTSNLQPPTSNLQPVSLLECTIETGRTHQIRVHMASLGCPVAGDAVYGKHALDAKLDPVPTRQLLHAWRLKIRHPADGRELLFEAPIPADMRSYCPPIY